MRAVEIVEGSGEVVITCEHASVDLPAPWTWPVEDAWVVGTHWSWDPGAADVARALAAILGAPAVLARFTRLLADPNREEGEATLFRRFADGKVIGFNDAIDDADRERRLAYHRAYHEAADRLVGSHPGRLVLSIHTFTPNYEGQQREVELGVLFDDEEELGIDLATLLADRGLNVWLNEPWSGKDGLIYSPERHAKAHGRAALELEVRNDLASDPAWREENVPRIAEAVRGLLAGEVDAP